MSSDNKTKNTVNDKCDIESMIKKISYLTFESSKTTVCEVTLKNTFVVIGSSICVDPANFDLELGKQLALNDALNKVRTFAAYELASQVSKVSLPLSTKKWKKFNPKKDLKSKEIN